MTREEAIGLRLHNQLLIGSQYEKPEEIVEWMGMMQAQDYNYFRWAIGMRMKEPKMEAVKESFSSGKIVRLHLLRCTVQAVSAQDYPWLMQLCRERNLNTIKSWPSYNQANFSEQYYQEGTEALKGILAHNLSLTKKGIGVEMEKLGLPSDTAHLNQILLRGEMEGLVCSGEMRGKDATWALVDERLKALGVFEPQLSETETLTLVARKYFRSHSPASFEDFCWWTGLPISQNRKAIEQIASELEEVLVEDSSPNGNKQMMFVYKETINKRQEYIKDALKNDTLEQHPSGTTEDKSAILLPPYDEYLIGYKSRWISLDKKHEAKAHNRFGIFKPVILYKGKVVGNWKASLDQGAKNIETDIFTKKREIGIRRVQQAEKQLRDFTISH